MSRPARRPSLTMVLELTDAAGQVLFRDRPEALAFDEACVLALSLEFFNDPAPCLIHRSAVIQRAALEIAQALIPNQPTPLGALPPRVAGFLLGYPALAQLTLHLEVIP